MFHLSIFNIERPALRDDITHELMLERAVIASFKPLSTLSRSAAGAFWPVSKAAAILPIAPFALLRAVLAWPAAATVAASLELLHQIVVYHPRKKYPSSPRGGILDGVDGR